MKVGSSVSVILVCDSKAGRRFPGTQWTLRPSLSCLQMRFQCFAFENPPCLCKFLSRLQSMESVNAAGILRDCMLPLVCSFPEDDWVRAFVNDELELVLLPRLVATCKEWHDCLMASVQYSALRVALSDFLQISLGGLSWVGSRCRKAEMSIVASKYEQASFLLSCSWALQVNVEERIWTASLADLSTNELQDLRLKLQDAWGATEIKAAAGSKLKPSSRTWITPSQRSFWCCSSSKGKSIHSPVFVHSTGFLCILLVSLHSADVAFCLFSLHPLSVVFCQFSVNSHCTSRCSLLAMHVGAFSLFKCLLMVVFVACCAGI